MTVYNELNKIAYIGNTSQTLYPIPFEYINTEDIKVSIYTSKNEFVEDWRYSTQYVIEGGNVKVLSGYAIDKNKKLLILRRVDLVQDNKYREGGDFPAKSTEASFDKLTMITQQLQETLDRCVKVEVLDIQTPEELLAEVYNKLDSATDIAAEAISAAEQAKTAADNATTAVTSAEKTLVEVNTYVDESKAEINALITKTTEEIDQTISDATEEIKEAAVVEANKAVQETIGASVIEAATSAEHARIWAEGEQADVKPLGGELSSKGWALQASNGATSASQSAAQAKTSETNAKGYADSIEPTQFLNKRMVTNCITEIPQDIKLELNNGTLTLKAGSKVYVPNGKNTDGSLKFDEVVIDTNKTLTNSYGNTYTNIAIGVRGNGNLYGDVMSTRWCSGATDTLSSLTGTHLWYDTTNNIVKVMQGTTQVDTISLPICLMTNKGGEGFKSITQVFNGFGYIGSTLFALPNVKGLIPNGRNADGSLRNEEFTITTVKTATSTSDSNKVLYCTASGNIGSAYSQAWEYREYENENYSNNSVANAAECVRFVVSSGVITSFTPKLPFHAIDRNDSSWVSAQAMPSGKYIDLTLGASGSKYTAPANGWLSLNGVLSSNGRIKFYGESTRICSGFATGNSSVSSGTNVAVKKDDVVRITYDGTLDVDWFCFIYAEGEN